MLSLMASILHQNNLDRTPYVEPFAGGCGLALGLLFGGHVSKIQINDIDPAIWSFWHSVLNDTAALIEKIESADLSIEGWRQQKAVLAEVNFGDPLSLGFSAFYLNRTNRSGVISGAGIIGGLMQAGKYKLDCRFNIPDLIKRIVRVAKYRDRISLTRMDALDFLTHADEILPRKAMFCIDPPYFHKGSSLYMSFYKPADHATLAKKILALDRPWIVTYDNASEIKELYADAAMTSMSVNYSAHDKRKATELLINSPLITLPHEISLRAIS